MTDEKDIILAVIAVAGLGLLIYAGEQLANWFSGASKAWANLWGEPGGIQAAGGLIPWAVKGATNAAISGMNYTLWDIPPTESQFDWTKQQVENWGAGVEKDVGNWWSSVEKRLEKGLTTWW